MADTVEGLEAAAQQGVPGVHDDESELGPVQPEEAPPGLGTLADQLNDQRVQMKAILGMIETLSKLVENAQPKTGGGSGSAPKEHKDKTPLISRKGTEGLGIFDGKFDSYDTSKDSTLRIPGRRT